MKENRIKDQPLLLIIEEDKPKAELLQKMISPRFLVEVSSTGSEGFEKAANKKPDLIIAGNIDGENFARQIKEKNEFKNIPLILLTEKVNKEKLELLKMKSTDIITEPLVEEELNNRVESLLQIKEANRLLQQELQSESEDIISLIKELSNQKKEAVNDMNEKKQLLRETFHRLKNNLQIIASLINLQLSSIKDEKAAEKLKDVRNRIKAISLVHEKINKPYEAAFLNVKDYVNELVSSLRNYIPTKTQVVFKIDMDDALIGIDQAVNIGLLINELVSNSIKHAFGDMQSGEVFISLKFDDEKALMIIQDNGSGLSSGIDWNNSETLGFQLITSFAMQLHGDISIENNDGTKVLIIFPRSIFLK